MQNHPKRNDPCPCGSGLKYKQCCEGKSGAMGKTFKGVPYWLLGLIGLAVVVGGLWMVGQMVSGTPTRVAASTAQGPPGTPWEYDEANNRYWDPDHGHWHDGRPPTSRTTAGAVTPATPPAADAKASPFGITPGGDPIASAHQVGSVPLDPTQPVPEAWTFDATNNRHYEPTHGHWHDGPAPYQYDPTTNKYWDSGHNHWHDGPPPETATYPDGTPLRKTP